MRLALQICAHLLRKEPIGFAKAIWWFVVGKRLRARHRLRALLKDPRWAYPLWIRLYEKNGDALQGEVEGENRSAPVITLWLHMAEDAQPSALRATLSSLESQRGVVRELIVSGPAAVLRGHIGRLEGAIFLETGLRAQGLARAIASARGRYLVPLRSGHELGRGILRAYVETANDLDEAALPILYGDQDERDAKGLRTMPWFKPGWDPDLFLAQDYVTAACAIPVSVARKLDPQPDCAVMDAAAVYRLVVHLVRDCGVAVRHVQHVAAHCPPGTWQEESGQAARVAVLAETLRGEAARIAAGPFGTVSIRWPSPSPAPAVTVIVPTRDRLDLLRPCIEGVLERTDYPAIAMTIVDNGSVEAETLAYLDGLSSNPRVTVVRWKAAYNYSELNNVAVADATTPYLCLLNNDIEVIDPDWLERLMQYAIRPDAGAVGAKLLYPDGTIQHAGVVIGMGGAAGHAHRTLPDKDPGYFVQAHVARQATAVTAACLVVARDKYLAVGGLDARDLRIAYNDVDFCLKLRALGLRNYYVPQARLVHHESKSRGSDFVPKERARYFQELDVLQQRWATRTFQDPTHHAALDRSSEIYRLSHEG